MVIFGRFCLQKNHEFLIELFSSFIKKGNNSKLILIGNGPLENDIKEKVKKMNLQDNVIFKEVIKNVPEYLQAMDVLVMPSIYEGLPLVGVEAQAASLPCVFSKEITREVNISNECFFIKNNEIGQWINKCEELKNLNRYKIRKNENCKTFDINYSSKELEKLYDEIWNKENHLESK